jgi:hypothetical protein
MQPTPNKRPAWLIVSLALTAAFVFVALRPKGADKWEEMAARIDKLKIETRSRRLPRSPLRGKLIAGNAWDEYNIALNDTLTWVDDQNGSLFARFVNGEPGLDRIKVEQLVALHAGAIEHLRRGTQRSNGQYPYNWERGDEMEIPSLLGSRRLANVSAAQARMWTEKGRAQDAADILLDVTVFSRDLATNGTLLSSLIGYALYSVSFDELRHLLQSRKLSPQQLTDLAQKLETVDRDFLGISTTLSNETMGFGTAMIQSANSGLSGRTLMEHMKLGDWRLVMSPRATMLEAYEIKEDYMRRSSKFDQMSYEAAKNEANAIGMEAEASTNALVRMSMPSLLRTIEVHRETLANLRVVRAGAVILATGQMPKITDPFGTDLLYKEKDGKLKIWSRGSSRRGEISLEIPK